MTSPDTARAFYSERGYFIHPEPIVEGALVDAAKRRIPALIREEYDTGVEPWRRYNFGDPRKIQKIDQVHLCDRAFHVLATHPAIGEEVARVTGADFVQVWATQLFIKPPGGEDLGVIGWHTDRETWPFWEGEVLTVWLALEDFGPDSGPVLYVEGSHVWPDDEKRGDAYEQNLSALEERLKREGLPREWSKVPLLVRAGGVGIHSADILHGSRENRSGAARLGLGINVRTGRSRRRDGVHDYGFTSWLEHPFVAPVIYPHPNGATPVSAPALSVPARGSISPPRRAVAPVTFVPPATVAREGSFALPHLKQGAHVLDAGCGGGALSTALGHVVAPGVVTAVDLDPQEVAAARAAFDRAGLEKAEVVLADVRELPFGDESFDVVFCHSLFGELADADRAARELFRVCKRGGVIAVRESMEVFEGLPSVHVGGQARPFSELWRTVRECAGGDPRIAPRLKGVLVAAGFGEVTSQLASDPASDPHTIAMLTAWLQSALGGRLGERAISRGVVSRASLDDVIGQMARWPGDPAAYALMSWVSLVARRG